MAGCGSTDCRLDSKKDVHLDGSSVRPVSRLEVLEGPSGRRVRSEAERARIVAESLPPGAQVSEVARKHGAAGQLLAIYGCVGPQHHIADRDLKRYRRNVTLLQGAFHDQRRECRLRRLAPRVIRAMRASR
ncbi:MULTISPECIES: transposase [unclassified Bradyrhizobium]|uniref:transposase n=1 Tax=unclassified Bradyrhizobium TaxID=2631580 RepID=UPI002112A0AB|nr:transposase [Bradyrhizobium sp. 2]